LSLEYFEGPAGCGKTYQIIESLKTYLALRPLAQDQAVLGVTYMHGSRRRMHSRLASLTDLRGRFLASTIDSVARSIVWRWKTLARDLHPGFNFKGSADFNTVCDIAAKLLEKETVAHWFAIRYPIVLVDELQDCKGDRLKIVRSLELHCHVIAAADEFQDLNSSGTNEAVAWLHSSGGTSNVLGGNRRTKTPVLLKAACELRDLRDCGVVLDKLLMGRFNANSAAGDIARTLCWKPKGDVVLLTPTGPDKSSFVRDVVVRLSTKSIQPSGINKPVGPFPIIWESNITEDKLSVVQALVADGGEVTLAAIQDASQDDRGPLKDLREWAERKARVKGQFRFSLSEVSDATDRIVQARRSFNSHDRRGTIRAMTISQAKNREFQGVILLWPFAVGGDIDSQRRRLYNALTRAQVWAIIIVQDNAKKDSRLLVPPFSKRPKASAAS
jgi:superfamily I DNA/RNA helicase